MGDGADADAVLALGETVPGLAGEDYPILAEVWSTTLLHENTMELDQAPRIKCYCLL